MRQLLTAAVVVTLHVALVACAVKPQTPTTADGASALEPNNPVDGFFEGLAPRLNAEAAKLPESSRSMAQSAYMVLGAAIKGAEDKGVDHPEALKVLQGLTQAADLLHALLHEADARAPTLIEEPNRAH